MDEYSDNSDRQDAQLVLNDTPCRRCSYNLRGLKLDGRCPECGTPVGVSTLGDLLRFSDPSWLEQLLRGLNLILIEVVVLVVIYGISLFMFLGVWRSWISLLASAIGICGAWLLTAPDPSGLGEAQYAASRKFVRMALGVELLWRGGNFMSGTFDLPAGIASIWQIASGVAILVGASGEFAKFLYLRKLADRIPHPSLARRAAFLQWSYPPLIASISIIFLLLVASSGGLAVSGLVSVYGLLSLLRPILFIVMIFFFIKMRRTIAEQLKIARHVWANVEASGGGRAG